MRVSPRCAVAMRCSNEAWLRVLIAAACGFSGTDSLRRSASSGHGKPVYFPFSWPLGDNGTNNAAAGGFVVKADFNKHCFDFVHAAIHDQVVSRSQFTQRVGDLCIDNKSAQCTGWATSLWEVLDMKLRAARHADAAQSGRASYSHWCSGIFDSLSTSSTASLSPRSTQASQTLASKLPDAVVAAPLVSRLALNESATSSDATPVIFPFRLPRLQPGVNTLRKFTSRLNFEHHCFSFIYALGSNKTTTSVSTTQALADLCGGASEEQCRGYALGLWSVLSARAGKVSGNGPQSYAEWCAGLYSGQLNHRFPVNEDFLYSPAPVLGSAETLVAASTTPGTASTSTTISTTAATTSSTTTTTTTTLPTPTLTVDRTPASSSGNLKLASREEAAANTETFKDYASNAVKLQPDHPGVEEAVEEDQPIASTNSGIASWFRMLR